MYISFQPGVGSRGQMRSWLFSRRSSSRDAAYCMYRVISSRAAPHRGCSCRLSPLAIFIVDNYAPPHSTLSECVSTSFYCPPRGRDSIRTRGKNSMGWMDGWMDFCGLPIWDLYEVGKDFLHIFYFIWIILLILLRSNGYWWIGISSPGNINLWCWRRLK